jgi:hypothetical protein
MGALGLVATKMIMLNTLIPFRLGCPVMLTLISIIDRLAASSLLLKNAFPVQEQAVQSAT